jgi:hypothetical protein
LRKCIFSVIMLMACGFWMKRNVVAFDNEAPHVADFLATIQTETRHWGGDRGCWVGGASPDDA